MSDLRIITEGYIPPDRPYLITMVEGGDGSGNFGHAGRPGEQGGSAPSGSSSGSVSDESVTSDADTRLHQLWDRNYSMARHPDREHTIMMGNLSDAKKKGTLDDYAIVGKATSMSLAKAKQEYEDAEFFTVELHNNGDTSKPKRTVRVMGSFGNKGVPKVDSTFGLVHDTLMDGGSSYRVRFGKVVPDSGKAMPLYFYD